MTAEAFRSLGEERYGVTGDMSFETAGELWEQSKAALEANQALTIDLGEVTAVDSAGLALLLEWISWAREKGVQLRFERLPDQLRSLARISEVEALLGIGPPEHA